MNTEVVALGILLREVQSETSFRASALVIATGGLSIPKMGATSFGYDFARQFGLKIQEPRPALVPLMLNPEDHDNYCDLSGVSADVIASCDGQKLSEKMLITHRGLSGPAILQISSYWRERTVHIDLLPGKEATANFADPTAAASGACDRNSGNPCRTARRPMGRASCPIFMDECRPAAVEKQIHDWESFLPVPKASKRPR